MRIACLIALVAAALFGCTPRAPDVMAAQGVVPGGVPLTAEHTLAPGGRIEIRFPFAADFNTLATVGPDGYISLDKLGNVLIGGLTVPQATARLKQRYAAVIRYPELSITVRGYAPEAIYVDGWVAHPGLIRSQAPLTVARAIARAGGAKTGARMGDILLIRRDAAGKLHSYRVALGGFAGAGGEDPLLRSFDIVYVPKTAIAAVSQFLAQYAQNLPFQASLNVVRVPPSVSAQTLTPQLTAPH